MKYASVVLDVDSTLCGVEGIDWLAQRRGPEVAARIRQLTERAMNGEVALDSVYGERLSVIRPSRSDVDALGQVYRRTIADGAAETIAAWTKRGLRVALISGGIREAIAPLARELGVPVYAVSLRFDDNGDYMDFERSSPLATQRGKLEVVRSLALPRPILAVGDGSTDIAMKQASDRFVAYTGFARREQVVAAADADVSSFRQLAKML